MKAATRAFKRRTIAAGLWIFLLAGCGEFAGKIQDFDTSGNGKLSAREISAGLMELTDSDQSSTLDKTELQQGFRRLGLLKEWDVNSDGRVTSLDFTFLFSPEQGDLDTRFGLWDDDGDGEVTYPEMADALFTKFDLNRDEQLDRGELERVLVVYKGVSAYDANQDGELSLGELRAASLNL